MSIFPQLFLNTLTSAGIYSLVALGFSLIYNTTKFFNLAHGANITIGAYTTFYLTSFVGLNLWLAIILAIVFTGFIGFVSDRIIFLPMRKKKATSMVMLIASLGLFTLLQAIVAILFSSQFQTLSNYIENQKIYQIFGASITQVQVAGIFTAITVLLLLKFTLTATRFGKAVTAVSDDLEVSKIVGINTDKIISQLFFIGSSIAGLAGILISLDTGMEPTMGLGFLLSGVIGVIVGGIKNINGVVLGCVILAMAENFGIWKISGQWRPAITFSILIIFLIFRPQGIFKND